MFLLRSWRARGAGAAAMDVGFIGLGRMGLPMCANLVRAGYDVTAGDLRSGRQAAAAACGARWGGTAAEVAVTAEVLITVLPGTRELHDMMLMPGEIAALSRGATWIDMTSTAPATGAGTPHAARASGVGMLDAPQAAESGQLPPGRCSCSSEETQNCLTTTVACSRRWPTRTGSITWADMVPGYRPSCW